MIGGDFGDHIASLPVHKYIQDNYPHVNQIVWYPDFFVDFAKHLLPGVIIKPFSKGDKEYNDKLAGRKMSNTQATNMGMHMTDNAFHILIDKQVDNKYKNYLQLNLDKIHIGKFALPEKYVVIPTGFTAEVREMKANVVNELSDYILRKGYIPVYLGSRAAKVGAADVGDIKATFNTDIDYSKGIDLINRTTLLEAGKICGEAAAVVGLDSGLLHVASCTDVWVVGGFTTVRPEHRMAYRKDYLGYHYYPVVPDENLACRFCQSNWEFLFSTDYRKCFYKEWKLDTEIKCVEQLTSDKYIKCLEQLL